MRPIIEAVDNYVHRRPIKQSFTQQYAPNRDYQYNLSRSDEDSRTHWMMKVHGSQDLRQANSEGKGYCIKAYASKPEDHVIKLPIQSEEDNQEARGDIYALTTIDIEGHRVPGT